MDGVKMGQIYLNIIEGHFIYKKWDIESLKEMEKKFLHLRASGYKRKKVLHDYENTYYHFKNKNKEEIIVTLLGF